MRQLVKYTETHPVYIPDTASSAVQVLEDGQIQKTVFPSLKPTRREDALLLQQWLADMMAQLTSNAPQAPADQVRCAVVLVLLRRGIAQPGRAPSTGSLPCREQDFCVSGLLVLLKRKLLS